jgi:hypothetical protein
VNVDVEQVDLALPGSVLPRADDDMVASTEAAAVDQQVPDVDVLEGVVIRDLAPVEATTRARGVDDLRSRLAPDPQPPGASTRFVTPSIVWSYSPSSIQFGMAPLESVIVSAVVEDPPVWAVQVVAALPSVFAMWTVLVARIETTLLTSRRWITPHGCVAISTRAIYSPPLTAKPRPSAGASPSRP